MKMSWDQHTGTSDFCKSLGLKVGTLHVSRLCHIFPQNILHNIFITLVTQSKIDYGLVPYMHELHDYVTRGPYLLQIPKVPTSLIQFSFSFQAPKIWNHLPLVIKQSTTRMEFKTKNKMYLLHFHCCECY
jgi:hypothetical protein